MGLISQDISHISGFQQSLVTNNGTDSAAELKKIKTIMDSMTDKELDNDGGAKVLKEPGQIKTIVRGSGAQKRIS